MSEKYADETSVKLKLEKQIKMILTISASVILATNFINAVVSRLVHLENSHEYQIEATKRRINNAIEKQDMQRHIEDLIQELEDCENNAEL